MTAGEHITAGQYIRVLRGERGLRPSDIERLTRRAADTKRNSDYIIPHATLHGIESGAIPTIYKLASLASVFEIRIEELLNVYGIQLSAQVRRNEAGTHIEYAEPPSDTVAVNSAMFTETELVPRNASLGKLLPCELQRRLSHSADFSYAVIGINEDILGEVLPGGSFVEIDRDQKIVTGSKWTSLYQRPIYCLWHGEGHICCWCEQTGNTITIVPHPLSRQRSRQLRVQREVNVIGRVVNSWRIFRRP
jgi:hypothetical protein